MSLVIPKCQQKGKISFIFFSFLLLNQIKSLKTVSILLSQNAVKCWEEEKEFHFILNESTWADFTTFYCLEIVYRAKPKSASHGTRFKAVSQPGDKINVFPYSVDLYVVQLSRIYWEKIYTYRYGAWIGHFKNHYSQCRLRIHQLNQIYTETCGVQ